MYKVQGKYKFRDKPNRNLWINGDFEGKMYYCTDGHKVQTAIIKYKKATGWNRTKCGQYFTARFPDDSKKDIFLSDLTEYR